MKDKKNEQIKWYGLLFIAIVFFILGLNTGNYIFNFITIVLGFIIYKNGYQSLFGDYDKKQQEKREKVERIYAAIRSQKKN